jgi:CheY-like chemotaxis protein
MNEEQMQRLFQSFSQADTSTTRKYGGTGLGLAISRQLVELMDGEIWVESTEGEGSTFGFTVALGVAPEAPARPFLVSPELGDLNCLVVDDNATSRDILVQYLSTFGLTVTTAASAEEAHQLLASGALDCDLVVTDWKMPGMNGIELSSEIRQSRSLSKQPKIVLVSAFHRVELMGRPGAQAIDRFLSKPVSPSHLFDAIMECFGCETSSGKERVSHLDSPADDLAPIRGAQVLLVEDNEINQQVASELLAQAGLQVTIANNGLEAIEQVEKRHFDVVLMDIQMPVMDGYEATGRLRGDPRYVELPILAMTANATKDDREKSLAVGMNAHINKPINPVDLFNALLTWVKPGERDPVAPRQAEQQETGTVGLELLSEQGFDIEGGISRVGGSASAYRRLLQKFSANQADSVARLEEAVRADDQELAVRTAHSLKGAAGALGISTVQSLAGTLEERLAELPLTLDEEHCSALADSLAAAVEAIDKVLPTAAGAPESASADVAISSDIIDQLETLKAQLEDFDSEAEDTLDWLRQALAGSDLAAELAPIARQVAAYDLEAAAEQLEVVLSTLGDVGSE